MQQHSTVKHPPPRKHRASGAHPLRRSRSSSLFSAIKNVVTAPLAWFSSSDFEEDGYRKRRRIQDSQPEAGDYEETTVRAKRMRLDSPEVQTEVEAEAGAAGSYDDSSMSNSSTSTPWGSLSHSSRDMEMEDSRAMHREAGVILTSYRHANTTSPPPATTRSLARTMSMDPPPRSVSLMDSSRNQYSGPGSRFPLSSSYQGRTMSMDPPARATSMMDISGSSIGSIQDQRRYSTASALPVIREQSIPAHAPFRMRTSLTPQPSSGALRATPQLRDSSPFRPPPLDDLMNNPVFVRRSLPPELSENAEQSGLSTLGSMAESGKHRSPLKQSSSWSSQGPYTLSNVVNTGMSPRDSRQDAERTLHDLELYRTPLLPTRLKGSTSIPEMFKTKEVHRPVMSKRDDQGSKSRLGLQTKSKGKKKESGSSTGNGKPYAGESSLKRLLARRRQEEDGEVEKVSDRRSEKREIGVMANIEDETPVSSSIPIEQPPQTTPETTSAPSKVSSLRVGRVKSERSHDHLSRPNRFSAIPPVDELEESTDERQRAFAALEAAAAKAPAFNIPANFSFQNTSQTVNLGEKAIGSNASIEPLPAGTFSKPFQFLGEQEVPAQSEVFSPAHKENVAPTTTLPPLFAPETASAPAISSRPKTPEISSAPVNAEKSSAIPNFFASSSILASAPPLPQPPQKALWAINSSPAAPDASLAASNALGFSLAVQSTSLSATDIPSSTLASSVPVATDELANEKKLTFDPPKNIAPVSTIFGSAPFGFHFGSISAAQGSDSKAPSLPSTFDTSVLSGEKAPATTFAFGSSNDPGFRIPESKPPFGNETPAFAFGVANGTASQPTTKSGPFALGAALASPAEPAIEKKSAFGDGPPSSDTPSKFTFGPSGASATPAPVFGSTAAPLFGSSTAPPAQLPSFGSGAGTSVGFGSQISRPATPPKNEDNEMRMDESPTRDVKTSDTSKALAAPFSFANASHAPFGQPAASTSSSFSFGAPTLAPSRDSPFGFGGSSTNTPKPFGEQKSETTSFSFGSTAAISGTGFSFGQKSAEIASSSTGFFDQKPVESTPTPSGFAFGQKPAETLGSLPPFAFGQKPADSASVQPFGQSNTGAFGPPSTPTAATPFAFGAPNQAPGSSPFGQPASSGFSFGSATTAAPPANPFSINTSQTSSPLRPSADLPGTPMGGGGAFTFGVPSPVSANPQTPGTPTSTTGFSFMQPTVAPSMPSPSGGSLFNIGSAPSAGAPTGPRQIKKLPSRRGGKK